MKTTTTFLVLFIFLIHVQAQNKHFDITWKETTTDISTGNGTTVITLPTFNDEYFVYNDDRTISFVTQWEDNRNANTSSLRIDNVSYGTLNPNALGGIDKTKLPTTIEATIHNTKARAIRKHMLIVSPLINENGIVKKVLSFDISYTTTFQNATNFNTTETIENSILASGNFYKFSVTKSGIYRIDANFLNQLGFNTENINPRKLKIYGNGGRMLPLRNSENQHYGIPENAITVIGENDNVFNAEDYILFYAEGPDRWNDDSQTHVNAFTDKTYYYITTEGVDDGKRIPETVQPSGTANTSITTFDDYQFHEVDNVNLIRLGRRWFGEVFNIEAEQTFNFNVPNIVTSAPVTIGIKPAAISNVDTFMSVLINGETAQNTNGQPIFNFTFSAIAGNSYASQNTAGFGLRTGLLEEEVTVNSEDISIALNYDNSGVAGSIGYLDYITVEAKRNLLGTDKQFFFRYKDAASTTGIGEYTIGNATNISQVWDVSNIWNVTKITNESNAANFSFKAPMGEIREYITLDNSELLVPTLEPNSLLTNQNLKGTIFSTGDVDYIIITPQAFASQAERLADFHRTHSGLNVQVVPLQKIYNEFNTGNPDVAAIRNFIKYVYDNALSDQNKLKYICMFGDASFDYKNRIEGNTNFVPVFHVYESFNLAGGYMTDDFYGMMDDHEGNLDILPRQQFLDIAIGRMLINSPSQAKTLVDKTLSYYAEGAYGRWRNNITIISDDADNESDSTLQNDLDALGNLIANNKSFINVVKIHSDSYIQESSSGGARYPEVNKTITDNLALGSLVVNYFGHGGEDGLAGERIFEKTESQELTNECRLPLFITITCEYTRFDNPLRQTAGEFMFWNEKGGAVALVSTTRLIYKNIGLNLNQELSKFLFSYGSDTYMPVSEAFRLAKNEETNPNKRVAFYIGDPALKIAIPKPRVNLTAINDVPISQATDTLKALSRVKISGNITNNAGNLLSDYNGTVFSTIYDKQIQRQTLANDPDYQITMDFVTLGEIIFRGKASVTNGIFSFEFIVPRDIVIPVGNGRISFYAKRDGVLEDHTGASENLKIGELNEDAPLDNEPPIVNLYMNDESFISGGITNESPFLLAKLSDENGINTASGIGHDIVGILDGDESNPIILNDYYETALDDYTNGIVKFPFRDLSEGTHTLLLKAWDVYNNSSTAEIQFTVFNENNSLTITNVLNYPNPFVSHTEFWFNHNSSSELDITVQVFTISGKVVRTLVGKANTGSSSKDFSSLSRDITWDGRDDFGDKLGKGVYVYKLIVKSAATNQKVEKYEKIVLL
ncbi:type IX secretion system sortase PorU [Kordia jejudonensis]|uniref:type IX secretion system sortase PorU n=1 Tax=Kordia jejudonensis TaxID=1348245 RepID=UPI0006291DBF|nr:type IX secretion system sortase PorU [Kordia jejudonensis]